MDWQRYPSWFAAMKREISWRLGMSWLYHVHSFVFSDLAQALDPAVKAF